MAEFEPECAALGHDEHSCSFVPGFPMARPPRFGFSASALRTAGLCVCLLVHTGTAAARCDTAALPIAAIRASTPSPWLGRTVGIRGVVSGDFSAPGQLGGFFVQQADAERARRPGIPEGVFVRGMRSGVQAGDLARLNARVAERAGRIELVLAGRPEICARGQAVAPAELKLPVADLRQFDAYEDMRVRLPQTLTVSDVHALGRYGSILLSHGRLWQPTQLAPPAQAAALAAAQLRNRLVLDDGRGGRDSGRADDLPRYPGALRAGQTVGPLEGILEMRHGTWQLQPLPGAPPPSFGTAANPRPRAPERHPASDLRVVSFNVFNYFNRAARDTTAGGSGPRGAPDPEARARQEAKLLSALRAMNADVIGLMEVANNGYGADSAVRRLAARLGPGWRVAAPGTARLGTDAIAVALLYDSRKVQALGAAASTPLAGTSRPPLAQTFRRTGGTRPLTVAVAHLKSKRCDAAAGPNLEQDDGQGCWNAARTASVRALADWAARHPTGIESDWLLIGDFNSYAHEDPPRALKARGYGNQVERFGGAHAYTYIFDGRAGYLDYAWAQPALALRIRSVAIWHINADEAAALQYDGGAQTGAARTPRARASAAEPPGYAPDAYRSSDHDPLLIDVSLDGA